MRPLVIALLGLLALAPAAGASTATVETQVNDGKGCTADPSVCQQSQLVYTAAPGEANDVRISTDGSTLVVRDAGADITPGNGCERQGQKMVRCSTPPGPGLGFVNMRIQLDDGNDELRIDVNSVPSVVKGGPGDDHLVGGGYPDSFEGGTGRDRLEGAGGPDFLRDNAGVDPDVFDGGDGSDSVSYTTRNVAVVVDLRSPANPSGAAGENDSLANIEIAYGGRQADEMRAGNAPAELSGRSGNDRLFGSFGADRLFGDNGHDKLHGLGGGDRLVGGKGNDGLNAGCGRAKLYGQAGRDRLYSANGAADRADGGADRDFARIDQVDVARRVERVDRKRIDACALDLRQRR